MTEHDNIQAESAKSTLLHYLDQAAKAGAGFADPDNVSEINGIVDDIIDAAVLAVNQQAAEGLGLTPGNPWHKIMTVAEAEKLLARQGETPGSPHDYEIVDQYRVTLGCVQLVKSSELSAEDHRNSPVMEGRSFVVQAVSWSEAAEKGLDSFHHTVAIKVLEHFEVTVTNIALNRPFVEDLTT